MGYISLDAFCAPCMFDPTPTCVSNTAFHDTRSHCRLPLMFIDSLIDNRRHQLNGKHKPLSFFGVSYILIVTVPQRSVLFCLRTDM